MGWVDCCRQQGQGLESLCPPNTVLGNIIDTLSIKEAPLSMGGNYIDDKSTGNVNDEASVHSLCLYYQLMTVIMLILTTEKL